MLAAERYGSAPLWPADVQARARAYQWSFWAANEIERVLVNIGRALSKPPVERYPEVAALVEQLYTPLRVLDAHLAQFNLERPHLLGEAFTVADLNLASTLREPGESGVSSIPAIELVAFPQVERWLACCEQRPANRRVAALAGPALVISGGTPEGGP